MKAVALSHYEYYTTKEGKVGRKFNIIYGDMKFIPRADDATKSLSDKAKLLASYYSQILNSTENDVITVRPESICSVTERKTDQNNNIHKQLKHIFNIKYYQAFIINGSKLRDIFVISYTENGRKILENPGKFYAEFAQVKCGLQPKKFTQPAEKICHRIDYIERKKNNLDSSLTNFNNCNKTQVQQSLQPKSIKSDIINRSEMIDEQPANFIARSNIHPNVKQKKSDPDDETKSLKYWMNSITETDLVIINQKAERFHNSQNKPFKMEFVHKLIEKLSDETKKFKYKNAVISYLAQALKHEKTPAEIANRKDFKFLNYQENYLDSVEQTSSTDATSQLRRKIAGAFDKITAFNLLMNYCFSGVREEKYDHPNGYIAKHYVYLLTARYENAIVLSDHQKQMLLNEVKAVFGNHIDSVNFAVHKNLQTGKNGNHHSHDSQITQSSNNQQIRTGYISPTSDSLWGRIRMHLINSEYDGEAMDYSWYRKLSLTSTTEQNNFILQVPTEFFKAYIRSNLINSIKRAAALENAEIIDIEVNDILNIM